MRYSDKLRHPFWQKKRLKIMERDNFKCTVCGTGDDMLTVHHGYYEWNKDPWDYNDDTLHTLCDKCHQQAEQTRRALVAEMAKINPHKQQYLLQLLPQFLARIDEYLKAN